MHLLSSANHLNSVNYTFSPAHNVASCKLFTMYPLTSKKKAKQPKKTSTPNQRNQRHLSWLQWEEGAGCRRTQLICLVLLQGPDPAPGPMVQGAHSLLLGDPS